MNSLLEDTITCLNQGSELVSRLESQAYCQPVEACFNSSIGGHMRHNVDHYQCFVKGLATGSIDYDARGRDATVEQQPERAAACLRAIVDELKQIDTAQLDTAVLVRMDSGTADRSDCESHSTYRRELQFLLSHTVHHFALIAVMAHILGIAVAPEFGVAPSTLKHHKGIEGECAR